jgi:aconitate hydratase
VQVTARRPGGEDVAFETVLRIDGTAEVEYHRHGGILQMVLREMLAR